jgi:hypothetical protein
MADNIFQGISAGPDPQPGAPGYYDRIPFRKWKDPPPRPTSKALVLVYLGCGKVLEHVGDAFDFWFEGTGTGTDLFDSIGTPVEGTPGSTDGMYVLEGTVRSFSYWTDCGTEHDCELDGDFRELNDEEKTDWKEFGEMEQWSGDHFDYNGAWPCVHCERPALEHRPEHREDRPYDPNPPLKCPVLTDEQYATAKARLDSESLPLRFHTPEMRAFYQWCRDQEIDPVEFLHLHRQREK